MKRFLRALLFSAVAVFVTATYNKGFIIHYDPQTFLKTVLLIAVFYYAVVPFVKLILLPFNIITLGLVSIVAYFLLFYFFISWFPFIKLQPWVYNGISIGYLANVIISAASFAVIINLLEKLL